MSGILDFRIPKRPKRNATKEPVVDNSEIQKDKAALQRLSLYSINALKFINWIKLNGVDYKERFPELDNDQLFVKISKYINDDRFFV